MPAIDDMSYTFNNCKIQNVSKTSTLMDRVINFKCAEKYMYLRGQNESSSNSSHK